MDAFKEKLRHEIMGRLKWFYVAFMILIVCIMGRLVFIQYGSVDTALTSTFIHRSLISPDTIRAHRGSIYSRDGETLATSIFRHSIFVDFGSEWCDDSVRFVRAADSLSKLLAAYFGDQKPSETYKRMVALRNSSRKYIVKGYQEVKYSEGWWAELFKINNRTRQEPILKLKRSHTYTRLFRDVDKNEWEVLKRYPILRQSMSIINIETDARVYPQADLALRTIGRTDKKTPYGIEYAYRDSLCGHHGLRWLQHITHGFNAEVEEGNSDYERIEAIDGADIFTTLDVELQEFTDKALRRQLAAEGGVWGTTMIMECATGDILAMANLGKSGHRYVENWDYGYRTKLEPGSTFKLATAIALLEDAGVSPSKQYATGLGKYVEIGEKGKKHKTRVADSHPISKKTKGVIDMPTAFAESSNVYFTKAVFDAYKDNPSRFTNFLSTLSLDRKMGLEALNEVKPNLPTPDKRSVWHGSSLVNIAYGYAIELAPIHTLTLYNAVANNGRMVAPRIVTRMERDGQVIKEFPVRVLNEKICSQKTLNIVRGFMEKAATEGTGANFFSPDKTDLRVGLKTGTAKVSLDTIKYKDGYYLASMVTYLPADNPKYTFMTAIFKHKSKGTSTSGAQVAGPMQLEVAQYLHKRDNVAKNCNLPTGEANYSPTDLKGGFVPHIRTVASQRKAEVGGARNGWGAITSDDYSTNITSLHSDQPVVPKVVGMGLADALFLLESRGLKVRFKGQGRVVKQSLSEGSRIDEGATIDIVLEERNITPERKSKN